MALRRCAFFLTISLMQIKSWSEELLFSGQELSSRCNSKKDIIRTILNMEAYLFHWVLLPSYSIVQHLLYFEFYLPLLKKFQCFQLFTQNLSKFIVVIQLFLLDCRGYKFLLFNTFIKNSQSGSFFGRFAFLVQVNKASFQKALMLAQKPVSLGS